MSRKIESIPKKDGFKMPGEFEPQTSVWLLWPQRPDNWRNGAKPAQKAFVEVAKKISKYTKVKVGVNYDQYFNARIMLPDNVSVYEISSNDAWARDCGPSIVKNEEGKLRGILWNFNAWGGLLDGLYFPWDKDNQVAQKICEIENIDYYQAPFVLEGGSIHVDGEGTVYTTEECLLHPSRNPELTKFEITKYLKDYLNVKKVIWIKKGLYNDETNGHIDNIIQVAKPGTILLNWIDNKKDPQYKISQQAFQTLSKAFDAKGRKIKVIKVPNPKPLIKITKKEALEIDATNDDWAVSRTDGERMAASYINHLITNEAIILPIFNIPTDKKAIEIMKKVYPTKKIETIKTAREIILGGGNVHCITQQIPKK